MAFGEQNEVQKLPTDYNIGLLEGAGNLRDSKNNSLNQVIDLTIKPLMASRKKDGGEKFYLTIRESWFTPAHTRKDLTREGGEVFLYDNFFGKRGSRNKGYLQQLFSDEQIAELGSLVSAGGMSASQFVDFLNDRIGGKVVGYILKQAIEREKYTDPDTGEEKTAKFPTEFKNVSGFFGPEDIEGLEQSAERAIERARAEYDRTGEKSFPTMRIFWETGVSPFEAAVAQLTA